MDDARFVDEHLLVIGPSEFHCAFPLDERSGRLPIVKERALVERYLALSAELHPSVIVELGIRRGGSTAMLHALNQPEKLVAVELSTDPLPLLDAYITDRGAGAVLRPYFGVDQSDRTRLAAILDDEIGDRPIDLVIDDASHLYAETLSSFETLFPRLRAGGVFVIEDWNFDHLIGDGITEALAADPDLQTGELGQLLAQDRSTSLTQIAVELVVARASAADTIREVTVNEHWIVVERGRAPLSTPFRLAELVHDHYGFIPT
jgi:predicted O-methyltransferase YrrM